MRRDTTHTLEAVTVSAIRGGAREPPISSTTLSKTEIESRTFGQDVPLLLQGVPSLTSYAETANYWGYSYLRIRGIDQSRINFTIDGIPLNDPEDQVLYFTDFPDLTNSIGSIQVQRGVGTSAPGTASYGGSINFQTIPVATSRSSAQLQAQGGSFGSERGSAEYASGLTTAGLAFYGRASALQSAGFRRHSGTEGRSGFFSVARVGARDILKFTATAGLFSDTLAYYGATEAELAVDRRFNPLRPDEVDHFGEQIAALSYTRDLGGGASAATSIYRISAKGNYDVCISACDQPQGDLWNFHLDFAWYGATTTWTLDRDRLHLNVGANANTYARDHYAYDRPDFSKALYFNTGHKDDVSAFGKVAYDVGIVTLFGDVQARHARFRYAPDANAGIPSTAIAWTFRNPKLGATARFARALNAYASYGLNSREPARSDMLAGFDNLDTSNAAFVGPLSRVRPERAHDFEAGLHYRAQRWSVDANAFAMEFRNEILPVGQLSYIGTPLRTNVRASWRRGVEMDFSASPARILTLGLTGTAMRGRITDFTDESTGQSYRNVEPLLTPRFTSSQRARLTVTPELSFTLTGRYWSRAYLNNTDDPALTLPAYHTADVSFDWQRSRAWVTLYVNNVTNSRAYASGHVSGTDARYYVLPPLNAFLLLRIGM
jgi:iron complex outermembrane receptor protein